MPGKKDSEYFPLNVNLYELDSNFSRHTSYEPFETEEDDGMSTDDELQTVTDVLRSRCSSNTSARPTRVRNVSLNMTENSDDEGGDSMQSSSDWDLDGVETETEENDIVDTIDLLVLNVREKLKMDSKFAANSRWTCSPEVDPPASPASTIGHNPMSHHLHRRRLQLSYPNSRNRNPLVSVQKKKSKNHYTNYVVGRRSKAKRAPTGESPFEFLEHLLQSGSLIKEAVRRLSSTPRRHSPQPSVSNSVTITPPNFTTSLSPTSSKDVDLLYLPFSPN